LNRYSYCRNNPFRYTDPTGHFFLEIIIGALIGAALNTSIAAITNQDIGMAALTGAISGAFFTGAGLIGKGLDSVVQAGINGFAGAASGAINAGIQGGDIGQGALIGGVSAGVAKYTGLELGKSSIFRDVSAFGQHAMQLGTRTGIGAVMGGISAEMIGGSFGEGASMGAWTAAYAYAFNQLEVGERIQKWMDYKFKAADVGTEPGKLIAGPLTNPANQRTLDLSAGMGLGTGLIIAGAVFKNYYACVAGASMVSENGTKLFIESVFGGDTSALPDVTSTSMMGSLAVSIVSNWNWR
jgi:hypothetical protein